MSSNLAKAAQELREAIEAKSIERTFIKAKALLDQLKSAEVGETKTYPACVAKTACSFLLDRDASHIDKTHGTLYFSPTEPKE